MNKNIKKSGENRRFILNTLERVKLLTLCNSTYFFSVFYFYIHILLINVIKGGDCVKTPVVARMNTAKPKPNSNDPEFVDNWIKSEKIDVFYLGL